MITEDAFFKDTYGNSPPNGPYEICYKGSFWSVETSKLNGSYVFAKGWSEVCYDLGILDDDLLIFRKIDDVVFLFTIYRDETEIILTKKAECDEDDVFQISKADYFEKVFKDIYADDKRKG